MRLIDGDELWDKAYEVWGIEADAGDTSLFMGMITDCPTIDPVKHGRWINTPGKHDRVYCSSCAKNHSDIEMIIDRQGHFRFFRYCPDCGAKMDLEEENDNE